MSEVTDCCSFLAATAGQLLGHVTHSPGETDCLSVCLTAKHMCCCWRWVFVQTSDGTLNSDCFSSSFSLLLMPSFLSFFAGCWQKAKTENKNEDGEWDNVDVSDHFTRNQLDTDICWLFIWFFVLCCTCISCWRGLGQRTRTGFASPNFTLYKSYPPTEIISLHHQVVAVSVDPIRSFPPSSKWQLTDLSGPGNERGHLLLIHPPPPFLCRLGARTSETPWNFRWTEGLHRTSE